MGVNHLNNITPTAPGYYAPQQQTLQSSDMLWVQGIEGAKAYLLAPGRTLPLWDSEEQCIYIKSTSPTGIPQPLTILDYTIRQPKEEIEETIPQIDTSQFVTKEEFDELKGMISDLKDRVSAASQKPPYTNKKGGRNYEK